MESRIRVLFLIACVITLSGCAATKNLFGIGDDEAPPPVTEPPGQVVDPEVERREIKEPAIDREDFEVTAFAGIISIEDFGCHQEATVTTVPKPSRMSPTVISSG